MNLDRYEKIDGREALQRLVDGEEIFTGKGSKMRLDFENHQMVNGYGGVVSFYPLHAVLSGNWYVPKPFDVRQAMLDRPNEWVAAYKAGAGKWFKIGFNTDAMKAVIEEIECDRKPFWEYESVRPGILRDCIPIEDVPEEATR